MPDHEEQSKASVAPVLVAQYRVAAFHHTHFMGLIWQVPAVTTGVAGVLAAIGFATAVPPVVRTGVLAVGTVFILVMTLSLERYRMFQLRRRKDMEEIEAELVKLGGKKLAWSGAEIRSEIRSGAFRAPGVRFSGIEGYRLLRAFMYLILLLLLTLTVVTVVA